MENDPIDCRRVIFLSSDPVVGRHVLRVIAEDIIIFVFIIRRDLCGITRGKSNFE